MVDCIEKGTRLVDITKFKPQSHGEEHRIPPVKGKEVVPDSQRATLIIDASSLNDLACRRGHVKGANWLQPIKLLGDLPTIDRIIVTELSADLETRKLITVLDAKGDLANEQFGHISSLVAQKMPLISNFLHKGSRWYVNDAEVGKMFEGSRNVLVYGSSIEAAARADIQSIRNSKITNREKQVLYDMLRGDFLSNAGEALMLDVTQNLSHAGPVFLVSEDGHFQRDRNQALVTNHGGRIYDANADMLIRAIERSEGYFQGKLGVMGTRDTTVGLSAYRESLAASGRLDITGRTEKTTQRFHDSTPERMAFFAEAREALDGIVAHGVQMAERQEAYAMFMAHERKSGRAKLNWAARTAETIGSATRHV